MIFLHLQGIIKHHTRVVGARRTGEMDGELRDVYAK